MLKNVTATARLSTNTTSLDSSRGIFFCPGFFLKLMLSLRKTGERILLDRRDYPFLRLSLTLFFIFIPSALFIFKNPTPWIFIPYLGLIFFHFLGPYTLMLHNLCHQKVFNKKGHWLEFLIVWVLGPLFGQTPGTYYAHHIGMHHVENNKLSDLSSTMKFQRDSLTDFSKYMIAFLVGVIPTLGIYLWKKRRHKLLKRILIGEGVYFLFVGTMLNVNWLATLVVFLIPLMVVRFAMMAGNWAQHAFIDPKNPFNVYRNSITCIKTNYNEKCFNDGYHIGHHLKMNRHWSEMPKDFEANIEIYRSEDAIVFEKLDYFVIWVLLMSKNYTRLAQCMVNLGGPERSIAERIAVLKSRLSPISLLGS